MKILMIDDSLSKIRKVREISQQEKTELIVIENLEDAIKFLSSDSAEIDGIILDMEFYYYSDKKTIAENAGNEILKFLEKNQCKINVIGYSLSCSKWYESYKYFWGPICFIYYKTEIINFIRKLKSHES